jgi:hypothetical protein
MALKQAVQVSGKRFKGKPVVVTDHALTRARQRFRTDEVEREWIAATVQNRIEAGMVFDKKPPSFRFFGEKPKGLGVHHYFVMDDERGWIVQNCPDAIVVKTSVRRLMHAKARIDL